MLEKPQTAMVRREVEKLTYVSRTWFEWTLENGSWLKTLVIEVEFDTDPNSHDFIDMDELGRTILAATGQTTMTLHHVRVVPRRLENA